MTENQIQLPRALEADEKTAQIMVYTHSGLCWGDVIVKEQIRVGTWLRTNAAPDSVCVYNAKWMVISAGAGPRPTVFPSLHIGISQVMAYHLVPPAKEPIDYDESEPNRKMEPVSILFRAFQVNGTLRMAAKSDLAKYIEVTRETFTSIYDAEIICSLMPSLGIMRVPFLMVRQSESMFAARTV
jgi:hypothetical protein